MITLAGIAVVCLVSITLAVLGAGAAWDAIFPPEQPPRCYCGHGFFLHRTDGNRMCVDRTCPCCGFEAVEP